MPSTRGAGGLRRLGLHPSYHFLAVQSWGMFLHHLTLSFLTHKTGCKSRRRLLGRVRIGQGEARKTLVSAGPQ